ncbi:MAG: RCC1 repeat- and reductase domain-containing protein [Magnetococcales bacterium]|nr:RCC1 repeat- and reductase domain-containing protein [Magnetococcales bacterium]
MKNRSLATLTVILLLPLLLQSGFVWEAHATPPKISARTYHTLALKMDGTVWGWGYNATGQLGNGVGEYSAIPVPIAELEDMIAVAAGNTHSLAVKSDGTVWAWGSNVKGQLGNGEAGDGLQESTPVEVPGLTDVVAVGAGYEFSVALKGDGTVWSWGYNNYGQLGNGTTDDSTTPVQVLDLTQVRSLSLGGAHVVSLKTDGSVWAWGANYRGQLGDGTLTDRYTPIQVDLDHMAAVTTDGPHSASLGRDGSVFAWGYNYYGQLGDGTTDDNPSPVQALITDSTGIASGKAHTLVLKNDSTVWAWGGNYRGQLGDGSTDSSTLPVRVKNLVNIKEIDATNYFSVAVKSDGTVWTWGGNDLGMLGDGTTEDQSTPVQVTNWDGEPFSVLENVDTVIIDTDRDGVIDQWDDCPGTTQGIPTFANGCEYNTTEESATLDQNTLTIPELETEFGNFKVTMRGSWQNRRFRVIGTTPTDP